MGAHMDADSVTHESTPDLLFQYLGMVRRRKTSFRYRLHIKFYSIRYHILLVSSLTRYNPSNQVPSRGGRNERQLNRKHWDRVKNVHKCLVLY
jgi:hypothetical protein